MKRGVGEGCLLNQKWMENLKRIFQVRYTGICEMAVLKWMFQNVL
jgi:hypothetical protein